MSLKSEPKEEFQQIKSGLEGLSGDRSNCELQVRYKGCYVDDNMEVLKPNVKTEPIPDEENALLEVKILKNEARKTSLSLTREAVSQEETSLFRVYDFKIKEEKYDEVPEETENTFVKVKTEQSVDSTNVDIISKFSESDDETVDCSQHDVMSLKSEPKEEFQQIKSELKDLSVTKEAASAQEGSSFIIFDFKIKNEKCDEVLKETENTFVKVKTEQNSDSTKDDIISKFSESDDETVDCSEFDAISLKNEKEPKEEFQQINSKLEGLSEKRTSTEEQHEVSKETEKLFIKVKSEQSDDSPQDGIISKFSESDDESVNCSGHDVMNLKKENKPKEDFQQMNSGLEILSEISNMDRNDETLQERKSRWMAQQSQEIKAEQKRIDRVR
ncbi:uncharacterized protein LOC106461364 isoform X7 [Limulus polyphemus]|uniref:Uncharacterized protein LOC106461364 isoform X7 n=1 Tax=Limulus polyphemus TaxID=6850 RepID=A0ABM1SK62_LIMPO|nr:uncharacterized protein LOC106461364 isoform X7 [Limulus polyphemus]